MDESAAAKCAFCPRASRPHTNRHSPNATDRNTRNVNALNIITKLTTSH